MKRKKMWLRWIAVPLLVILCINSVGTIALSAESQKEGNISETEFREEKSIPEKEFREEEKTLEKGNTPEEVQEEKSIPEGKNRLGYPVCRLQGSWRVSSKAVGVLP